METIAGGMRIDLAPVVRSAFDVARVVHPERRGKHDADAVSSRAVVERVEFR